MKEREVSMVSKFSLVVNSKANTITRHSTRDNTISPHHLNITVQKLLLRLQVMDLIRTKQTVLNSVTMNTTTTSTDSMHMNGTQSLEIVKDVRKKSTVELSLTNLDHGLSVEQDGAQVKTLSSGHTT